MRYPNRGAIVTKLSMTDVLEIWQLREILEPAACGLAADRIDRDALARIEGAFLELRGQEMGPEAYETFLRADVGLHGLIVDSTGNATLRSVLGMLNERIVQVRVVRRRRASRRGRRAPRDRGRAQGARRAGGDGRDAPPSRSARQSLVLLA
jgi:DNA-binding GntR family transcriptional regulator